MEENSLSYRPCWPPTNPAQVSKHGVFSHHFYTLSFRLPCQSVWYISQSCLLSLPFPRCYIFVCERTAHSRVRASSSQQSARGRPSHSAVEVFRPCSIYNLHFRYCDFFTWRCWTCKFYHIFPQLIPLLQEGFWFKHSLKPSDLKRLSLRICLPRLPLQELLHMKVRLIDLDKAKLILVM